MIACLFCREVFLPVVSSSSHKNTLNLLVIYIYLQIHGNDALSTMLLGSVVQKELLMPINHHIPIQNHIVPIANIFQIFFILTPAYTHIMRLVRPITNTDHKSGMRRKIDNNNAFITKNLLSIVPELRRCCFLINHHAINNTYHSLKNSEGCIEGKPGRSNHPLAHQSLLPNGVNTSI